MKSGGPWNLRGLRPQAREAAREAARQSGVSVGEWLNGVIEPTNENDNELMRSANFEGEIGNEQRQAPRRYYRNGYQQNLRRDDDGRGYRPRDASTQIRDRIEIDSMASRQNGHSHRQSSRRDHDERRLPDRERSSERGAAQARDNRRKAYREAAHDQFSEVHERLDTLSLQLERLARAAAASQLSAAPQRRAPIAPGDVHSETDPPLTGAPAQRRRPKQTPGGAQDNAIEDAVAEITARQRELDGDPAEVEPNSRSLLEEPSITPRATSPDAANTKDDVAQADNAERLPAAPVETKSETAAQPNPAFDLTGLQKQLRELTSRIESLRPTSDLEAAITALRNDLTQIGRQLTEALPRSAVESLENEVKALAQRIDQSRQSGVDSATISGIESGLAEVREALRKLTTAENLVGFDEAVKTLSQKFDAIVAKEDPAALEQLETAISGLRGIVAHVASNDTLTKVAEDVRSLSAKVDGLASKTASGQAVSALEERIDRLSAAITASAEAGQSIPRDLEKLLTGVVDKLEWVQLTHTDHAALAHLEDRIATLVKRFDASEARLGQLEAVERGLADLLVHVEQIRGITGKDNAKRVPAAADDIQRDVAGIKRNERRTQDSLEAVQDTVEHVVDRLAMIESNMHRDIAVRETPIEPVPAPVPAPAPEPTLEPVSAAPQVDPVIETTSTAAVPVLDPAPAASVPALATEPAPQVAPPARKPIDPNLPPNHPLEPGSTANRARSGGSAAERVAASEAAIGSVKSSTTIESSGKTDFIAAARRAAQAAAAAPAERRPVIFSGREKKTASPAQPSQRMHKFIVAGAAALIAFGVLHVATRYFQENAARSVVSPKTQIPTPTAPAPTAAPTLGSAPAPTLGTATPDTDATHPPSAPLNIAPAMPNPTPDKAIQAPLNNAPDAKTAQPGQQSNLDDGSGSPVPSATLPSPKNAPASETPPVSSSDVTGSLPRPASTSNIATAAAPNSNTSGDTLPTAIGGPVLRAAAIAGDAAAAFEVATRFAEGRGVPQSYEEAARWLTVAAKQGLAPAEFRLGGFYEKGIGVKKDLVTARNLYYAAAEKGNGKAMHNLAVIYAEGINGPADYRTAAQWFRKGADHGITDSQYNLGILYAHGIGVEQNNAESYKWFTLAANQGDKDAAKKRDEVAAHLDPQSLAAARLAAQKWTAQAQPEDAINVKAPAGGWDAPAKSASTVKSKPRHAAAKTLPVDQD